MNVLPYSGEVSVNESLDVLSRKLGLYKVCPTGKEASTRMDRLSYDGKSSVVRCKYVWDTEL